jgi:arylsulfatase A-like enzyme
MGAHQDGGQTGERRAGFTRRRVVATAGLAAAQAAFSPVAALTGAADRAARARALATPARTPDGRPNVVLIVADDLDANLPEMMPAVNALLREEGTTFANAFVTDPSCGPSRASLLRGQYVHNHEVFSNGGEYGGFARFYRLGHESSTIATWLQEAGYRTALIGKYLNYYPDGAAPDHVPPGWDEWYGLVSTKYFRFRYNDNGRLGRTEDVPAAYQTDVLAERAQAFVRETVPTGEPFFLYIAPKAPHDPATPAPRHADAVPAARAPRDPSFNEEDVADKPDYMRALPPRNERQLAELDERYRRRLRTMLAVDELIAGLVETLAETGILENTYFFFTSDNGHFLGEHRLSHGKGLAYDGSLRVPLLVRGPGVAAGRSEGRLVNNADLAPTIAALAGVEVPDFVDGRSLTPLLHGEETPVWRQVTLVEDIAKLYKTENESAATAEPERGGEDDEEAENEELDGGRSAVPAYRALRALDWLYVAYETGERELYDLRADPYQLENRAGASELAAVEARLAERLKALAGCAGAECRALEDEPIEVPAL